MFFRLTENMTNILYLTCYSWASRDFNNINLQVTLGVRHNRADIQALGLPTMAAPHPNQPLVP